MTRPRTAVLAAAGLLLAGAAGAADPEQGARLHAEHCTGCHASHVEGSATDFYTRPDRKIGSLPDLRRQVRRCRDNLGLQWFDDQVEDVVAYLNRDFYHFGE